MVSLTLGHTALCLTLLNFILSYDGCPRKAARVERPHAPAVATETREYRAENGYELAVTSLGGIIGLRGPKELGDDRAPLRDYYRLTYRHPRGQQVVASTAAGGDKDVASGSSNFVPVSFESPPSGAVFSDDQPLTAKVTVRTSDGLLRLTHLLTWKPGADSVSVQTEIANADAGQAVSVMAFERVIEVAGEGAAAKDQGASKARYRRFLQFRPGQNNAFTVVWEGRCIPAPPNCPPPPPLKSYLVTGDPAAVIRQRAANPSEVAGGKTENSGAPSGQQSDGAASLVWEFKSPLSRQTPAVVTTRFSLLDTTVP